MGTSSTIQTSSITYLDVLLNGLDDIDEALGYLLSIQNNSVSIESRRLRKNTLLKLCAGIELVLKAKLFQENWTYIFADMNKANKPDLKNGDFISIGGEKIASRLQTICDIDISKQEKEYFSELKSRRNKAEHFILPESDEALVSVVNKNVSMIIIFIESNFEQEVLDNMKGKPMNEIHEKLRESTAHEDEVRALAQKRIDALNLDCWDVDEIHNCPECFEHFFVFGEEVDECYFCGYKEPRGVLCLCEDCGEVFNRKEAGWPICQNCVQVRYDYDRPMPGLDNPKDWLIED